MQIINKYKVSIFLNYDNSTNYSNENKKNKHTVNYLFEHRSKFLRNFIYFYSVFLLIFPFSYFSFKNNPEFRVKVGISSILLLDDDYNNFFLKK